MDELIARNCLNFQEAFEEYSCITGICYNGSPARKQFRDKLLLRNGLPIIIASNAGNMPLSNNNLNLCKSFDHYLAHTDHDNTLIPTDVAASIPTLMKLVSSTKDRAISTYVLAKLASPTKLSVTPGMQQQRLKKIVDTISSFANEVEDRDKEADAEAESYLENLIPKLETDLKRGESLLNQKRWRLDKDEIVSREFDIENKEGKTVYTEEEAAKSKEKYF